MSREKVREYVAQAWCTKENKHKEMDVVLANAIVDIIMNEILPEFAKRNSITLQKD